MLGFFGDAGVDEAAGQLLRGDADADGGSFAVLLFVFYGLSLSLSVDFEAGCGSQGLRFEHDFLILFHYEKVVVDSNFLPLD